MKFIVKIVQTIWRLCVEYDQGSNHVSFCRVVLANKEMNLTLFRPLGKTLKLVCYQSGGTQIFRIIFCNTFYEFIIILFAVCALS